MPTSPPGCLGFLFRLFGFADETPCSTAAVPEVRVNKYFVSDAEGNFFRVLRNVVGGRGHVLAQVSLGRLLWFPGGNKSNPGRQAWVNRVARKSVDFVVCDSATLSPKVVIELDDSSHSRPDRQTRDDQVEIILEAAGLPVIHVLPSRTYDTRELDAAITEYLGRR